MGCHTVNVTSLLIDLKPVWKLGSVRESYRVVQSVIYRRCSISVDAVLREIKLKYCSLAKVVLDVSNQRELVVEVVSHIEVRI